MIMSSQERQIRDLENYLLETQKKAEEEMQVLYLPRKPEYYRDVRTPNRMWSIMD